MALERTFSIIKPDAVAKNVIGAIYNRFESAGLRIVASKMVHLSKEQAEGFYAEHKERPFFGALVSFMTSGPVMVQVLEGENAVIKNREIMGATNQQRRQPVRYVPIMLSQLMKMPFTVQMRQNLQLVKLLTSSLTKKCVHVHAKRSIYWIKGA